MNISKEAEIVPVLAIDYGTVRIGLAVSRYTLADPLEIIPNNENKFEKIRQVCLENEVAKIIVGMSENEMAEKTKEFVTELQEEIFKSWERQPTIEFFDETLSSKSVHQKLQSAKKSKRSSHIDHLAAAEFLQDWLDQNY